MDIDSYRMPFLKHFPGLRWTDIDDMPHWLWEQCRDEVDRIEKRG